jgi:hypothetical protein
MKVQMLVNRTRMLSIVDHDLFQFTARSSHLISRPGKAGSYKQHVIQQIVHAAFDALRMMQHFPCDSNF